MKSDWVTSNFEQLEQRLPGASQNGSGEAFRGLRREALARFQTLGFPSSKQEEWKYTNVAPLLKYGFEPAPAETAVSPELVSAYRAAVPDAALMVFVNGLFVSEASDLEDLPKEIVIRSLSEVLSSGADDPERALAEQHLGSVASFQEQAFTAINTAFLNDGAFIHLAPKAVCKKPILLLFISNESKKSYVTHPRVLVIAEESSEATIVECFSGAEKGAYLTSSVTEVVVRENASVDHYRLQFEGAEAFHMSSVDAHQERASTFATHSFSFGGSLVRNEVNPTLDGEGIHTTMNGLSVLNAEQHVDNHTVIDHAKPHCESYEWYKGIYGDKSCGVFNGTIIVRQDAQKTNAFQSNQSLLLSTDATIDSKPQLKIWADDVKCSHGATVGQLDEDALFYLRSRGLKEDQARNLLVQAFAGDIIAQVKIDALKEFLTERLLEKLAAL